MSSLENIPEKVALKAYRFEQKYAGCGQAVLGAFKQQFNFISDDLFKAGTGLAAGLGMTGNTCGAFLASCLVVSVVIGRDYNDLEDKDMLRYKSFEMVKELSKSFLTTYHSLNCREVQKQIMGRYFDLWDKEEKALFEMAGGHRDKCPSVCSNAARWAAEILVTRGLL